MAIHRVGKTGWVVQYCKDEGHEGGGNDKEYDDHVMVIIMMKMKILQMTVVMMLTIMTRMTVVNVMIMTVEKLKFVFDIHEP